MAAVPASIALITPAECGGGEAGVDDSIPSDPLLRLYFSAGFAAAMDRHVHTEFPLTRDRLHPVVE
ncbi:hypothetical protein MHPYR_30053 [uncultured Mycobacterium sp.]|uniref:Uncharacterized protein n=1 Tax=uncultured Mycobacterium sp. TaxID=171292 RepID=A0A1Y5PBG9_9MYCO|nr:hypothetical protein MHPYR_30053 [uncultured Mycobacterium sp.]